MNKAYTQMLTRTVQASILAFLFWLGEGVLGWPWLLYLVIATLVYAIICLVATVVIWVNGRK